MACSTLKRDKVKPWGHARTITQSALEQSPVLWFLALLAYPAVTSPSPSLSRVRCFWFPLSQNPLFIVLIVLIVLSILPFLVYPAVASSRGLQRILASGSCQIDHAIDSLEGAEAFDTAMIMVEFEGGRQAVIDVCRQAPYG